MGILRTFEVRVGVVKIRALSSPSARTGVSSATSCGVFFVGCCGTDDCQTVGWVGVVGMTGVIVGNGGCCGLVVVVGCSVSSVVSGCSAVGVVGRGGVIGGGGVSVQAHEQSLARLSVVVFGLPSLHAVPGVCSPKGMPAQSIQLSNASSVGKRQTPH